MLLHVHDIQTLFEQFYLWRYNYAVKIITSKLIFNFLQKRVQIAYHGISNVILNIS